MIEHTYFDDSGHAINWSAADPLIEPFEEPPVEDLVLPIDLAEYVRVQESILEDLYPEEEL